MRVAPRLRSQWTSLQRLVQNVIACRVKHDSFPRLSGRRFQISDLGLPLQSCGHRCSSQCCVIACSPMFLSARGHGDGAGSSNTSARAAQHPRIEVQMRFCVETGIKTGTDDKSRLATVPARHVYIMPVSRRAASDIMCRFHGGSNTRSTSASATVGIISSLLRTSSTRISPMPQPGAVSVILMAT